MSDYTETVRKSARVGVLLAGVLSAVAGCSGQNTGDGDDPSQVEPTPTEVSSAVVLAQVITQDGTEYSFLQSKTGDLTLAVGATQAIDIAKLVEAHANVADLYEALSRQTAPEALRAAEQRLADDEVTPQLQPPTPGLDLVPEFNAGELNPVRGPGDLVGRSAHPLTSAQFQNMYCPSGWHFLYCWPDTGGNPWVQRDAWSMHGAMSATNCSTRFRFRYYDDGDWYTLVDRVATPGQHWTYYQFGSTRSRRFEVLNNGGCGVRFSAFGYFW
jgi:hypothetical protein